MNEANEGNNTNASSVITFKRKRGRPRKDKSLNRAEGVRPRKAHKLNRVGGANMPPGFGGVNGNRPNHADPIDEASDGMVGQAVAGVVEAVFDDGYLLAIKIGNSDTCLRGVVFKPGHCAPVTPENDVAPRVQMIRRNEILLPTQNQTRVRGSRSLGNGSPSSTANRAALKAKHTAIVAAPSVPPVGARGTVVPVVLEPVSLAPLNQVSLKGKHVQSVAPLAMYDPNGSRPPHQQTSSEATPKHGNGEGGLSHRGSVEVRHGDLGKSTKSTPGEIIEEVQGTSQTRDENISSACKLPAEDGDMNEPLFIEPLRTVHTNLQNRSPFVVGKNSIGRMTELLQAVQENLNENQLHAAHLAGSSKVEFHEKRVPETGLDDEKIV